MKNRSHRRNINRTRLRHGDFAKYKNIFDYDDSYVQKPTPKQNLKLYS